MRNVTRSRWARLLFALLRIAYGLFFIGVALVISVYFHGKQLPVGDPRAQAFFDGLDATGFIDPLVSLFHVVGGLCLLIKRTIPLGLGLLAPAVTVIVLTHILLTGALLTAALCGGVWLILAWHHRDGFWQLWNYGQAITGKVGMEH